MSKLGFNLCRSLSGLLLALLVCGCQMNPSSMGSWMSIGAAGPKPPAARLEPDLGLQIATASQAAKDRDLAQVLHEVEELGRTDPVAQQKLLETLQQSKPELWPLVVQQFRSSLAYHKQLVASESASAPIAAGENPAPAKVDDDAFVWPSAPTAAVQASFTAAPAATSAPAAVEPATLTAPPLPAIGTQSVYIEPTPLPLQSSTPAE